MSKHGFKVGDRIKVLDEFIYFEGFRGKELEVHCLTGPNGLGVGFPGNDPKQKHNPEAGWLCHFANEVVRVGNDPDSPNSFVDADGGMVAVAEEDGKVRLSRTDADGLCSVVTFSRNDLEKVAELLDSVKVAAK